MEQACGDPVAAGVVDALTTLARNLALLTFAGGVWEVGDLKKLKATNVDYVSTPSGYSESPAAYKPTRK